MVNRTGMAEAARCTILRLMTTRITHVFFDATDTLLRLRVAVAETYAQVARRHGVEVSVASLRQSFSRTSGAVCQDIAPHRTQQQILQSERRWWYEVARGSFAGLATFADFDAVFEDLFDTYREAAAWELLPHARDTLATLRDQGIACSIISDMDSRLLPLLRAFEIDDFFAGVYLSYSTGYCKPDARLFTAACAANHVRPQRAVHIGDSWRKDVLGARGAGLNAVWYRPQGSDDAHAPWISDLTDLPLLLQRCWPG